MNDGKFQHLEDRIKGDGVTDDTKAMQDLLNAHVAARSPFIEGTKQQWAWDSTSIGWLKICPRLYKYQGIWGWQPKSRATALVFGQLYHRGLEVYEKAKSVGRGHERALRDAITQIFFATKDWESGDPIRNKWTLVRSLVWYIDEAEFDAAETKVFGGEAVEDGGRLAVELSFELPMIYGPKQPSMVSEEWDRNHGEYRYYSLCGHLDRVVEFQGETWVMDHKTTKSQLGDQWFASFDPDNQMSLYSWAASKLTGEKIRGMIVDGAQIGVGFTRFARGFTSRTASRINEWLDDLKVLLRQNEGYVAADYWPMNDKACRGCAFRNVCSADPSVRERLLESDFIKQPWNPLVVRG